jgi:membrane-associated protease RseP (regulator of RpoE activity)
MAFGLRQALFLYLAGLVRVGVFVASTCALLAALGGRARGISVGLGRVIRFQAAGVKVQLGLLPFNGFVEIAGLAVGDVDRDPGSWSRLGLGRRLAVLAGPWLVTFALAVLCLGPARALTSSARAVPQMVLVLDTTPLVRAFLGVLAAEPFPIALGVVCAKTAAFNLLPLGTLAGGRLIHEIVQALRSSGQAAEDKPSVLGFAASMIFLLYTAGHLAWGFLRAVW